MTGLVSKKLTEIFIGISITGNYKFLIDVLHWLYNQCQEKTHDIFTLHMRISGQIVAINTE